MTDTRRIEALRASLDAAARHAAFETASPARSRSHDDLAWAFGVASMTGWRVIRLPETFDPGAPFAALDPEGRAWLRGSTVDLPPDLAGTLAGAEGPAAPFEYVDARFGGAGRGRHAIAEAAVDALLVHGNDLWRHVISVPDGIEGKAEEALGVDATRGAVRRPPLARGGGREPQGRWRGRRLRGADPAIVTAARNP